jgi:hypothetical protein
MQEEVGSGFAVVAGIGIARLVAMRTKPVHIPMFLAAPRMLAACTDIREPVDHGFGPIALLWRRVRVP